jgi:hypothetical protein
VFPINSKRTGSLCVTFNDNSMHGVCVFFNDANCTHAALVVNTSTISTWNQVTLCDNPIRKEQIFTIATVQDGERPGLMTRNIMCISNN